MAKSKSEISKVLEELAKKFNITKTALAQRLRNNYKSWKPQELKVLDKYGGLEKIKEDYNSHLELFRKRNYLFTKVAKILGIRLDTVDEKFSGRRNFTKSDLILLNEKLTIDEKEMFREIRNERRNSK